MQFFFHCALLIILFTHCNKEQGDKNPNNVKDDNYISACSKQSGSVSLSFNTLDYKANTNGKMLRDKRNRKVARICVAIAVVCVLSLLPGTVAIPIGIFLKNSTFVTLGIRTHFFRCLINPFIYGFFDRKCKEACKELYRCS